MHDQLNALLILFCRLISTRRLYFAAHPKVVHLTDEFFDMLQAYFRLTETGKLFIGIQDDNLVFEGKNLVGPSVIGRQLFQFAAHLKCGGISFARELSKKEVTAFIDLAGSLDKPLTTIDTARELMSQRAIHHIEIAAHYRATATESQQTIWEGQESEQSCYSPALIYQALFDNVAQAYEDVKRDRTVNLDTTRSVSEYMLHFTRENFSDLLQQVEYPDHDTYTVGHSVRVAALGVYFANVFGWKKELVLAIGTAGLLHDIGKSRIPAEILHKPGRLTDEEYARMTTHSRIGAEILMAIPDSSELEIAAAWGHHIRNDGGGYPHKPSWAVRHPLTALLHICDVFEALTALRPYKPPLTPHTAYGIMLKDRGAFHLNLLASFISVVGLYPPGNRVLLSNDSQAVVTLAGQKIDRPTVRITHSPNGEELGQDRQRTVDLADASSHHLSIRKLLQVSAHG